MRGPIEQGNLYHFEAKAFLMRRGDRRARPAGGRALTAAATTLWVLAAAIMGNGIRVTNPPAPLLPKYGHGGYARALLCF